jgi:hypothetical protein
VPKRLSCEDAACVCRPRNRRFSYPATPRARAFQVPPPGPPDSASTTPATCSPPKGTPEAVSTSKRASGAPLPTVAPEGGREDATQYRSSIGLDRATLANEEISVQSTDNGSANRGGVASAAAFGSVSLEQMDVGEASLRSQGQELADVLGGIGTSSEHRRRRAGAYNEADDDTLSLDEEIKQILRRDA